MRNEKFSTKVDHSSKYWRDTTTTIAIASNLAKETEVSIDTGRAYFNERDRKNKYSYNPENYHYTDKIR